MAVDHIDYTSIWIGTYTTEFLRDLDDESLDDLVHKIADFHRLWKGVRISITRRKRILHQVFSFIGMLSGIKPGENIAVLHSYKNSIGGTGVGWATFMTVWNAFETYSGCTHTIPDVMKLLLGGLNHVQTFVNVRLDTLVYGDPAIIYTIIAFPVQLRTHGSILFRAAAQHGFVDIVDTLLSRTPGTIDPGAAENYAVRYAVRNQHRQVTQRLLTSNAIHIDESTSYYMMEWALRNNDQGMSRIIVPYLMGEHAERLMMVHVNK